MRSRKPLLLLAPLGGLILLGCTGPSPAPSPSAASPAPATAAAGPTVAAAATPAASPNPAAAATPTVTGASAGTPTPMAAATAPPTPTVPITPAPAPSPAEEGLFGFGRPASQEAIARWDIDVRPDGSGLPPGSGTAEQGAAVYRQACATCHGPTGREGGVGPPLVSSPGPYQVGMPRTIGSYWPYATTVFDYIYRAMPFDRPGSLQPDQVYAVVAYLLRENGIIGNDQVMDQQTLPQVSMPNRGNFISCWPQECRPDVP